MKRFAVILIGILVGVLAGEVLPRPQMPGRLGDPALQYSNSQLPDSCAIVATQAAARLQSAGVWTRLLHLTLYSPSKTIQTGHMVTVWQLHDGSTVLVYDQWLLRSTLELQTKSRDLKEIMQGLAASDALARAGVFIVEAHFVE